MHNVESVPSPQVVSRLARFHATILSALAPLLLLAHFVTAAPITVPTSLLAGQQYRLAFVTAGTRGAASTNIADYDVFVTEEANMEAALSSISWQVIGSTPTVSARDHTGTAPDDYPGVPIFLLNDVKLVDDYADLWDGSLDTPLSISQHGELVDSAVWTGTDSSGVVITKRGLGQGNPIVGYSSLSTVQWIAGGQPTYNTWSISVYALSGVLVVPVPEARPTALLTLGFAAILLARRVRGAL